MAQGPCGERWCGHGDGCGDGGIQLIWAWAFDKESLSLIGYHAPGSQIFRCLPSNATRSLRALREYVTVEPLAMVSPPLARSELTQVQGHLVHFPLKFLEDESLLPTLGSKEGMMPLEVWT